ncbi:vesicle transport protein SFT2B-like [Lytechinus variegatus]|uniref:vesicle transport protein SFT2B-like n=1 Tax=Lytechinus variegatus TaxID=7654 RepID=UPI001BB27E3F|nr:vesicle transport protein SFT2B-like [Lytechinus variegatus]XP_041462043.1 vesicle transport protein SFT2B-like [Lytechinus variegatus]
MDKLKKVLRGEEEEQDEQSIITDVYNASSLSWSTRIKGFIACFVIGCALSILGSFLLFIPSSHNLRSFAILYCFGTVIALSGTLFLMGPINQLKNMFKEKRIIATLIMLLMIALTLMAACWWQITILAILFCFLQFLASLWYSISYIPYARDAVKKCCEGCFA